MPSMTDKQEMELIRATIAGCCDAWNSGLDFHEMMDLALDASSVYEFYNLHDQYVGYLDAYLEDPQEIIIDVIV